MNPINNPNFIVENAVKHGICQKEEGGGTVTLEAKEDRDCYVVTVTDDGVGFTSGTEEQGEHIGIRNVRQRLEIMCHATLELESEPGKGTTSTICIPKESKE